MKESNRQNYPLRVQILERTHVGGGVFKWVYRFWHGAVGLVIGEHRGKEPPGVDVINDAILFKRTEVLSEQRHHDFRQQVDRSSK